MPDDIRPYYSLILKQDLYTYIHKCFMTLNPGLRFVPHWYLELLASALQDCLEGRLTRLMVNMPPRFLKSISVSVAFVTFYLGHHPEKQVMCISYGHDLSDKHAADCLRIMQSDWYKALFPRTRLVGARPSVSDFSTTRGGGRLSTSMQGMMTGRGADLIILDDPAKAQEALSEKTRAMINEIYSGAILSRLNSQERGIIIIVMQRLHQDDLCGHVLEREPNKYKHICLPIQAEEDQTFSYHTIYGPATRIRKKGEPLNPGLISEAKITELRASMGEFFFMAQMQQNPVSREGLIIRKEWLRFYNPALPMGKPYQIIQSWDTAVKDGDLNDYSACVTFAEIDGKYYLLNVFRKKLNYAELMRAVIEQQKIHNANAVLIEDASSGAILLQELQKEGYGWGHGIKPENSKVMRLYSAQNYFENGLIFFPESAHWLEDLVNELTSFPNVKHDDQVDAISQFVQWVKGPGIPGYGWFKFMEQQVARQRGYSDDNSSNEL